MRPVSSRDLEQRARRRGSRAPRTSVTASRGVVGVERVPRAIAAVAADRRLDPARARPRLSAHEREVPALDPPLAGSLAESARGPRPSARRRSRPDVSRSSRWTIPGRPRDRRPAAPSASRPCASVPVAWPPDGMDDEPGGLVDDEQVLVLADDVERRARSAPAPGLRAARPRPPPRPSSRWLFGRRSPSTSDGARRDQALRERARADLGTRGERPRRAARPRPRQERESGDVPTRALERSAATNERKRSADADDDEGVGEVERRPVVEVEEVGHVPEPERGRRGSTTLPPSTKPDRDGQQRMSPAGAREEGHACAPIAIAVSTITIEVAFENSPNAIPVLRTWWIENGPDDLDRVTEREARSRRSPSSADRRAAAASATRPAPTHCADARRERALRARDRLQRVRRRADADLEPRAARRSARAGSLMPAPRSACTSTQSIAYGTASSRSSGICLPHGRTCRTCPRRSARARRRSRGRAARRSPRATRRARGRACREAWSARCWSPAAVDELAVVLVVLDDVVRGTEHDGRASSRSSARRCRGRRSSVRSPRRRRAGAPPPRVSAASSSTTLSRAAVPRDDADVAARETERVGEQARRPRRWRGRAPAAACTRIFHASP